MIVRWLHNDCTLTAPWLHTNIQVNEPAPGADVDRFFVATPKDTERKYKIDSLNEQVQSILTASWLLRDCTPTAWWLHTVLILNAHQLLCGCMQILRIANDIKEHQTKREFYQSLHHAPYEFLDDLVAKQAQEHQVVHNCTSLSMIPEML